jgi:hypothetical protein
MRPVAIQNQIKRFGGSEAKRACPSQNNCHPWTSHLELVQVLSIAVIDPIISAILKPLSVPA